METKSFIIENTYIEHFTYLFRNRIYMCQTKAPLKGMQMTIHCYVYNVWHFKWNWLTHTYKFTLFTLLQSISRLSFSCLLRRDLFPVLLTSLYQQPLPYWDWPLFWMQRWVSWTNVWTTYAYKIYTINSKP